jgi:hypothetical protein
LPTKAARKRLKCRIPSRADKQIRTLARIDRRSQQRNTPLENIGRFRRDTPDRTYPRHTCTHCRAHNPRCIRSRRRKRCSDPRPRLNFPRPRRRSLPLPRLALQSPLARFPPSPSRTKPCTHTSPRRWPAEGRSARPRCGSGTRRLPRCPRPRTRARRTPGPGRGSRRPQRTGSTGGPPRSPASARNSRCRPCTAKMRRTRRTKKENCSRYYLLRWKTPLPAAARNLARCHPDPAPRLC